MRKAFLMLATLVGALLCSTAQARADGPVSLQAGFIFPPADPAGVGGATQVNFGLSYDVLRIPVVPLRLAVGLDYANGVASNGSVNDIGGLVTFRLTTPVYAGVGLGVYGVTAKSDFFGFTSSTTGIGSQVFVGVRLFSLPGGIAASLQGTFRQIPWTAGVNPSGAGVGLRIAL